MAGKGLFLTDGEPPLFTADELAPGMPDEAEEQQQSTQLMRPDLDKKDDDKTRAGPPTLDEWQGFFSRVVIKVLTDWYIQHAFKDVDENALSKHELELLSLTKEERDRIAVPYAELANKVPFTRKHGRIIVASADAIDSTLTLSIWFGKVNRMARRHKPLKAHVIRERPTVRAEANGHGNLGESVGSREGEGAEGGTGTGQQFWSPGTG